MMESQGFGRTMLLIIKVLIIVIRRGINCVLSILRSLINTIGGLD